ncbi:MAG: SPOR domain-containing protein [Terriglobales bacterium]
MKKKSYPVFVANAAADKLFHVQVGPFGDLKDAEAMKSKLMGDGYNPIVKR